MENSLILAQILVSPMDHNLFLSWFFSDWLGLGIDILTRGGKGGVGVCSHFTNPLPQRVLHIKSKPPATPRVL